MTGSGYGGFDLPWLLHHLTVEPASGRLAVAAKGLSALEAYLQGRYNMYRNVYFHKVVRSAEGMLRLALHRARDLDCQGQGLWSAGSEALRRALTGQSLSIAQFTELDDVSVLQQFKAWMTCGDKMLSDLCHGLLYRKLYKSVDLTQHDDDARSRFLADAASAVTRAGGDPAIHLFYDEPADTPYETFRPDGRGADEIIILDDAGRSVPFGRLSAVSAVLNRQLMFRRLHVAPQFAPLLSSLT